jgi:hypothetical protein
MPLEATQHTDRGARAFAAFFIKTIDWGFATVNGRYAQHFSAPQCSGCLAFIRSFNTDRREHHRYLGGRVTIKRVRLLGHPDGKRADYTAAVLYDLSAYVELAPSGKPVDGDRAQSNQRFYESIGWHHDAWFVEDLSVGT